MNYDNGSKQFIISITLSNIKPAVFSDPVYGSSCAPQILILFINMMLLKKTESKDGPPCQGYIYAGQDELQKTFLVLAFLCIPVILFGKPVYQIMSDKKRRVSVFYKSAF